MDMSQITPIGPRLIKSSFDPRFLNIMPTLKTIALQIFNIEFQKENKGNCQKSRAHNTDTHVH